MKTVFSKIVIALIIVSGFALAAFADDTRSVSGFNAIALSGSFHVHVKLDGTESLKIKASDATTNEIETIVEDGTLKIRFRKGHHWSDSDDQNADIYVTAKTLNSLVNAGSGDIKVDGSINASTFKAVLSGSGEITTTVKSKEVSAVLSGSGSINLAGSSDMASIVISGSGNFRGKGLKTGSTKVMISGSGDVSVSADKELTSNIIGSGSVVYSGNATVNSSKLGSGSVRRAD